MKWQVGDMALIISVDQEPEFIGLECEITSLQNWAYLAAFDIYVPTKNEHCCIYPKHLKPLPDGNQASTWENCIWQPKELVTCDIP